MFKWPNNFFVYLAPQSGAMGILLISLSLAIVIAVGRSEELHYQAQNWNLREVTIDQLIQQSGGVILVDARSLMEYNLSHIPNAVSLSPENWDDGLASFLSIWTPERAVVVYCGAQSCGLSKEVALRLLKDLPEIKVVVLRGGFSAWQQRRLPFHAHP